MKSATWRGPQLQSDDPDYTIITEYLIKIEGQSYLHLEWHTVESLRRKFGSPSRIQQRLTNFHASEEEIKAQNLDRYGGEPFDPRYVEVDRIVASNIIDVEEEPEERAARERKNREEVEAWQAATRERQAKLQALAAAGDVIGANALAMEYMRTPLQQPIPKPPPTPKKVEMFLVKWCGLSYSQCSWETREDVADEPKIAEYRRFNQRRSNEPRPPTYTAEELAARKDRWYNDSPPFKSKNKLRDYQVDGLNFLIKAFHDDRNVILADGQKHETAA